MENIILVKREDGSDIKIDVLFGFKVEEFNKEYIAYTIDDDGTTEIEPVLVSEYDRANKKLISIPFEQRDLVLHVYEEMKTSIMED